MLRIGFVVLLAAFCHLAVVLHATSIRAVEINDVMVRLTNVSPRFVEALMEASSMGDNPPITAILENDIGIEAEKRHRSAMPDNRFEK